MRFYLLTLGCPKNVVDSEAMTELLRAKGHIAVVDPQRADVLIVNTCGFLESARQEALEELRQLASGKRRSQFLLAAGCLAQRDGLEIIRQVPEVDGLVGTRRWMEVDLVLKEMQAARSAGKKAALALLGDPSTELTDAVARPVASAGWAYLKISDGCDASCAFCTIPHIKGPMRSRPLHSLVSEARDLAHGGAQELILIGQDTTAYGRDLGNHEGLSTLVREILAAAPELRWLRLMYAFPGSVTTRLIETIAIDQRVCHYLDLPLQHAHPGTLRRMRRPAKTEDTLRLIERLRKAMPDIALRSTFIVGYPGETAAEFGELVEFVRTVRFDKVGVFMFSAEPGTRAAELDQQIDEEIKKERYELLMETQQVISLERNRAQIGRQLDVLVEGTGDGMSVGRSYRDAPEIDGLVLIEEELPVAQITPVYITDALEYDLVAKTG